MVFLQKILYNLSNFLCLKRRVWEFAKVHINKRHFESLEAKKLIHLESALQLLIGAATGEPKRRVTFFSSKLFKASEKCFMIAILTVRVFNEQLESEINTYISHHIITHG